MAEIVDLTAQIVKPGGAGTTELRCGWDTVEKLFGMHNGARQVDMHVNVVRANSSSGPRHVHTACGTMLRGRVIAADRKVLGEPGFGQYVGRRAVNPPRWGISMSDSGDFRRAASDVAERGRRPDGSPR